MTKQQRFKNCIDKLKGLGFKGDVNVSAGLVIIGTHDQFSTDLIKKGLKKATTTGGELMSFNFNGAAVFVWVDDELTMKRPQVRKHAQEYLKAA